jgi:hypothetical protein
MKDFQTYQQEGIKLGLSLESMKKQLRLLSYDQIKELIDLFVRNTANNMKKSIWSDDLLPQDIFLNADLSSYTLQGDHLVSSLFTYFVQKMVVPADSKISMIGDLHGDIDVLLSILGRLFESRLINENFQIIDERLYLVFLGDYVNRRPDSLSVMYLLSVLVLNNPGKVILMRGNHEYASTSKYFHERFLQGRGEDTHLGQETLIGELYKKSSSYAYPDLLYWFDYLPMALYIGSADEQTGITHFVSACHGGLEVGVDFAPFLADAKSSFMRIMTMNRAAVLNELRVAQSTENLVVPLDKIFSTVEAEPTAQSFVNSYKQKESIDFSSFQSPFHLRLGEQWNNFLTEDQDGVIEAGVSLRRRTMYLGRKLATLLLQNRSSEKVCVHGVIRGHQHLDEEIADQGVHAPMLSLIRRNNGVVRQWSGMVYTLGASDEITGWHSFIMLTTAQNPQDWSLQHFFKRPQIDSFTIRMYQAFSE